MTSASTLPSQKHRRIAVIERQLFWAVILVSSLTPIAWLSTDWMGPIYVLAGIVFLNGTHVLSCNRELSLLGGIGPLKTVEFFNRDMGAIHLAGQAIAFDERELALRQHAFALAYHILSLGLLLMFSYLALAKSWEVRVPGNIYTVLWIPVWFALTLPSDVIAWIEPNRPEAE